MTAGSDTFASKKKIARNRNEHPDFEFRVECSATARRLVWSLGLVLGLDLNVPTCEFPVLERLHLNFGTMAEMGSPLYAYSKSTPIISNANAEDRHPPILSILSEFHTIWTRRISYCKKFTSSKGPVCRVF